MLPQNYSEIFANGNELHVGLQVYYACNLTFANGLGTICLRFVYSQSKFGRLILMEAITLQKLTHIIGFVRKFITVTEY